MSDTNVRAQLAETWKSRLQRFYDSDATVAEFCAAERVSTPSFYQWQRRIQSLSPGFVPTERRRRKRQRPSGFESTSAPAPLHRNGPQIADVKIGKESGIVKVRFR